MSDVKELAEELRTEACRRATAAANWGRQAYGEWGISPGIAEAAAHHALIAIRYREAADLLEQQAEEIQAAQMAEQQLEDLTGLILELLAENKQQAETIRRLREGLGHLCVTIDAIRADLGTHYPALSEAWVLGLALLRETGDQP